ncbi:hypothetical protein GeomeDRAFT_3292 [Geobacter metallireducens RCH3]|uniref:hypothetical protein n=1 Tax=Geobacter metallireducens TaxID=28232 RepID=UPI00024A5246|nr:hypothetical protein [Geobacter metallireducens]EHP84081.1 hypothetical protein GeomeDRAFT_3292 [Geobacter metallireducens RCH3]
MIGAKFIKAGIACPNAGNLYATVGKQPRLPPEQQMNSSRHFMRELNRFGLTSLVDAGDGSVKYKLTMKRLATIERSCHEFSPQDQANIRGGRHPEEW